MTRLGSDSVTPADAEEIRALLADIDLISASDEGRWANKRRTERRRVCVPCTVRYLAPDGETVLTENGQTRDLSALGLGFVTCRHFARDAILCVIVIVGEGKSRKLTGRVVYSRLIREGWYLTGVKFETIHCPQLQAEATDEQSARSPGEEKPDNTPKPAPDRSGRQKGGTRERALRMLGLATGLKRSSKDTITRVILLSASDDHVVRRATVPALMQIGGPEAKAGLIRLLEDPNHQIQVEAAEALGQLRATTAIEPLKALLKHEKAEVALRVAAVLGRLDDRSGITVVGQYLLRDNPHTRVAVRALGIITGQKLRLNEQGIAEARRQLKKLLPR